MTTPILYSFRRCPYAMRARLALMHCGAQCIVREVSLRNKPVEMLNASSKGTVPVLLVPADDNGESTALINNDSSQNNHRVLDESIDIMHWAMNENPLRDMQNANGWQTTETMNTDEVDALIDQNDFEFKEQLDKYKYSDRHPEHTQHFYLEQAMPFLEQLEIRLAKSPYLGGSQFRFPDAAILPFIRQFSMVEPKSFDSFALPKLQQWLAQGLKSDLFVSVMIKYSIWDAHGDQEPLLFGRTA